MKLLFGNMSRGLGASIAGLFAVSTLPCLCGPAYSAGGHSKARSATNKPENGFLRPGMPQFLSQASTAGSNGTYGVMLDNYSLENGYNLEATTTTGPEGQPWITYTYVPYSTSVATASPGSCQIGVQYQSSGDKGTGIVTEVEYKWQQQVDTYAAVSVVFGELDGVSAIAAQRLGVDGIWDAPVTSVVRTDLFSSATINIGTIGAIQMPNFGVGLGFSQIGGSQTLPAQDAKSSPGTIHSPTTLYCNEHTVSGTGYVQANSGCCSWAKATAYATAYTLSAAQGQVPANTAIEFVSSKGN